ncbi:VOC family protein [Qipengyuania sp. S6317L1]|uniref:VOC family protein n=1 Tax=Qipengyuania sp. S6317L1 TaxID=2926410 RepID=UPI001FF1E020|nr:VOC family protein [Qipengyuania sp. S6317L1]MCK0098786.1 VOC family protein [Qipengyuania sp. S6317L1]
MIVERLDHVNIVTEDLTQTARFYAELLDLEERDGPPSMRPDQVRWMYDSRGQAILHLNSVDFPSTYKRPLHPGAATGAIHHVALRCEGFETVKSRLRDRGADFTVNEVPSIGLTQIFTIDPNNVLLELNFFAAERD